MRRRHLICWICALLLPGSAPAPARTFTDRPTAVESRQLSFGMIAASASAGTVTVNPDGARICRNIVCLGSAYPALFRIMGASDYMVAISVSPAVLSNGQGDTLAVNPIHSIRSIVLRAGNTGNILPVGGELRLAANQPPGSYSGGYDVIFDYE